MLKKRIIPCLDVKDGRTVKGVNFENLRDAGNAVELAAKYAREGADELVLLDITATNERRDTFAEIVEQVAREVNIPFTVGGGIRSVTDVEKLLKAGADKVSINTAAVKNPELINELAQAFGSQCIVVAVDAKLVEERWMVTTHAGQQPTDKDVLYWCVEVNDRGAGEILLTSMMHDGTKDGFAVELTNKIAENVGIPVIASGGAGKKEDFTELFQYTRISAGLAAGIFHFGELTIPDLKTYLKTKKIPVR